MYKATNSKLPAMKYVTACDPVLLRPSMIGTVCVVSIETFPIVVDNAENVLLWKVFELCRVDSNVVKFVCVFGFRRISRFFVIVDGSSSDLQV